MKWLGWAICVLGIHLLITSVMGGFNVIGLIAGILIAVLALMAAIKG
jgi:hypothetical protein